MVLYSRVTMMKRLDALTTPSQSEFIHSDADAEIPSYASLSFTSCIAFMSNRLSSGCLYDLSVALDHY